MKKHYIALAILNISGISHAFADQCPPASSIHYDGRTWVAQQDGVEWRGYVTPKNARQEDIDNLPAGDPPRANIFAGATAWPNTTGGKLTYKIYCTYATSSEAIETWVGNDWFEHINNNQPYMWKYLILSPSSEGVRATALRKTARPAAVAEGMTPDDPNAYFWIYNSQIPVFICGLHGANVADCQFTLHIPVNPPNTGIKRPRSDDDT
jgi:hypothetical protein